MKKNEFDEWKASPQTVEVMRYLNRRKQEVAQHLVGAGCLSESVDKTAMNYAEQIGQARGMEEVIDLEFEDIDE